MIIGEEVKMVPITYVTPFCHNREMVSIYTYTDNRVGLFVQFKCQVCGHVDSRLTAIPKSEVKETDNKSNLKY